MCRFLWRRRREWQRSANSGPRKLITKITRGDEIMDIQLMNTIADIAIPDTPLVRDITTYIH
ncbi:MAG TPA: hypothetical protein VGN92_09995, partial [Mycobacterium sp.]|nr:hypothetical protein [Mycobacterium sp.]